MAEAALDALSPLAAELRVRRPDHYLATLFAPAGRRTSLIALYTFEDEIARVPHLVSEPMAGLIRLQWWEDAIDGLEGERVVRHPVLEGLAHAIYEDGLERRFLTRAIEACRQPLLQEEPPDEVRFEACLDGAGGNVARAAASLLGVGDEARLRLADAAGAVASAWTWFSALTGSRPPRRPWLPAAWLRPGDREGDNDPARAIGRRIAERPLARLAEAREGAPSLERSTMAAFFPGTLARLRLQRMLGGRAPEVVPAAPARLLWHWLRGRV